MKSLLPRTSSLFIVCGLLMISGCGSAPPVSAEPEAEPQFQPLSYKEALEIYNQELMALDQLKRERERLQASLTPNSSDLVGDLLGQARDAQAELDRTLEDLGAPISRPKTDDSEDAGESDPFEALGQQLDDARKENDDERQGILDKIAQLEKEIAAQEKRVERARADRDAADASRP